MEQQKLLQGENGKKPEREDHFARINYGPMPSELEDKIVSFYRWKGTEW